MVVAVGCEIVSVAEFPANREKNREPRGKAAFSGAAAEDFIRDINELIWQFPGAGTGIFSSAYRELAGSDLGSIDRFRSRLRG